MSELLPKDQRDLIIKKLKKAIERVENDDVVGFAIAYFYFPDGERLPNPSVGTVGHSMYAKECVSLLQEAFEAAEREHNRESFVEHLLSSIQSHDEPKH